MSCTWVLSYPASDKCEEGNRARRGALQMSHWLRHAGRHRAHQHVGIFASSSLHGSLPTQHWAAEQRRQQPSVRAAKRAVINNVAQQLGLHWRHVGQEFAGQNHIASSKHVRPCVTTACSKRVVETRGTRVLHGAT